MAAVEKRGLTVISNIMARSLVSASLAFACPAVATSYTFTNLQTQQVGVDLQAKTAILTGTGDIYYTADGNVSTAYEIHNGVQSALSGSGYLYGASNSGFVVRGSSVILL